MPYSFMHIEKIKSYSQLTRANDHNKRLYQVSNADPSKTKDNVEIIPLHSGSLSADFKQKIKRECEKGYKPRANAVLALEIILAISSTPHGGFRRFNTLSPSSAEFMEQFKKEHLQEWLAVNKKWLQDQFGEKNVIYAVCHLDETSPRIHAIVVPILDGRLQGSVVLGGKSKLKQRQQDYAKCMAALGLDHKRPTPRATHLQIRQFYQALQEALDITAPEVLPGESIEDYRDRVQKFLETYSMQVMNARNSEEDAAKSYVSKAMSLFKTEYIGMKNELETTKSELAETRSELARTQSVLQEKTRMLEEKMQEEELDKEASQAYFDILYAINNGYFSNAEKKKFREVSNWVRQDKERYR